MFLKRKWRLLHQLLLLSAVGLLPLSLIGAWGIYSAVQEQRKELERSALDLSKALTIAVDAELESTINALRTLSYMHPVSNATMRDFYDHTQVAVREQTNWLALVLADGAGQWIFTSGLPFGSEGGRINDVESMKQAIQTKVPLVGNLAKGRNQRLAFPIRLPIVRNGKVDHVLSAAVTPDRILDIVNRQNVPQGWVISVFDANGVRVARSKDHDKTVGTRASASLAALIQQGKSAGSGITHTLEGDEIFTGYSKIPRHNWTVAVGAPTHFFRTHLSQTLTTYAAGIFISLLLCIAVAAIIARQILGDIGALRDRAISLGQGKPVRDMVTKIREVEDMALALQLAADERIKGEQAREALLGTLNATLTSFRDALSTAEEAGRAKDEFLAVLSHELRNPLAPIVNALQLIELRGEQHFVRERQVLKRQVNHMRRLVDDLLDVSRITRGKLEIRREPIELQGIIQNAIEAIQPALTARKNEIKLHMSDTPVWINGDDTRLVQVFTNLLSNALRFSASGDVIVRVEAQDAYVKIAIEDQGFGMTAETIDNIFKPFYQAKQALARSTGGLGLGLAIVYSIVELHYGQVSAKSDGLDRGSVFEVTLPTSSALPSPTIDTSNIIRHTVGNIIIVDDNIDAAQTIADGLKLAGHAVITAHHPAEALERLRVVHADVAILDIGLPDMDGYALAECIRAQGHSRKVVALSGYGLVLDKAKSAKAGFDLHLTKPVDLRDLLSKIDDLLS